MLSPTVELELLTSTEPVDDDDDVSWNSLAACALPPLIWAHTIYVVPTVSPDGQLNVPEKPPFVTVSVVALLSAVNGLQVLSVISVLYPKTADTDVAVLGPLTVIVVPGPPDVGVLVSVEAAVPEVTVKVPTDHTLEPSTAQTLYVLPDVIPGGKLYESLKKPLVTEGEPIVGEPATQLDASYPILIVPVSRAQVVSVVSLVFGMLLLLTETDEPAAPVEGPNVNVGVVGAHAAALTLASAAACAGKAAPQPSAVSANTSTAEHTISAMLVETIFARFTPVFMLPSPKGPS
jgi:hypothetical protein